MTAGKVHTRILMMLLAAYTLLQLYCMRQVSINYDEASFYLYGVTLWKGQREKDALKFDSKLPITALNVLPRAIEQLFHPGLSKTNSEEDIFRGRYVSLLGSLLLALLIYRWAQLLYGPEAALVSLLFFLLCPNFLAHGLFVSSDIFAALFMTASLYFLWQFNRRKKLTDFWGSCAALGLALISKFSMIHLLIIHAALLVIPLIVRKEIRSGILIRWRKTLFFVLIYLGTIGFIMYAAHLFQGIGIPLSLYSFKSIPLQALQQLLQPVGDWIPVLLPKGYISSLDLALYYDQLGGGLPGSLNGPTYLLGETRSEGFNYYYWVVLLFKLPVGLLGCLIVSLCVYLISLRRAPARVGYPEVYLLVPVAYYLIYMNYFYATQIGIRHILMILPLLYIFLGWGYLRVRPRWRQPLTVAVLGLQALSVGLYFPHFLPYTNELIPDKKMAYTRIADTNLCYGEGKKFLREYQQQHPEATYLPKAITPGIVILEVNEMLDHNIRTAGTYRWARSLTPAGHIHSQYLIFDISPATADSLKRIYRR